MTAPTPLATEIATYDRLLPGLLADEGKHVVIVGATVLGVFEERDAALAAGYAATGGDFLCRRILRVQPVHFLPTMFRVPPATP